MVLWCVAGESDPDPGRREERLLRLRAEGPGPEAFSFRNAFAPPAAAAGPTGCDALGQLRRMAAKHTAPKGTFDILPEQERSRELVAKHAGLILDAAGYGRIETPAFEATELFARGVGESTDIVNKEMYTFEDLGGRSMTLRPEGTAPICRAYVEHGMHKDPQPVKLWYSGPFFRYEAPQKGRFRQFNQVGAEAIGTESPLADAELIVLLDELLRGLGITDIELRLASLGSAETRLAYREELREYLRGHESELSGEVRSRLDSNPMRAFDSDHPGTREVMAGGADDARAARGRRRRALRRGPRACSTRPASPTGSTPRWSAASTTTAARSSSSPASGSARSRGSAAAAATTAWSSCSAARRRRRLAGRRGSSGSCWRWPKLPPPRRPEVFVVCGDRDRGFALVQELRRARISAQLDLAERAFKGQMKQANRAGAHFAVILEEDGTIKLRNMESGEQDEVEPAALAQTVIAAREA